MARFRNRCASSTLTAAVDGAVGIAQKHQRRRGLQVLARSLALQQLTAGPQLPRDRSRRFIIVRMTLAKGRATDAERAFYGRVW